MSAQRSIRASFAENSTTPSPSPPLPAYGKITITGPEQIVFDSASTRCSEWYGPDLPAHAIRSADGEVRLYISWWSTRSMVGPDLDHLRYDCSLVLASHWNDDPAAFDDTEWLAAPYTTDGETVYSLVHMELHPGTPGGPPGFWAVTLATSRDGGRSFQHATAPSQLVATMPDQFGRGGPFWQGMGGPSNIVHGPDGFYYAFALVNDLIPPRSQGTCLMRTNDLSNPGSWTAWNDRTGGWTTTFVNPFLVPPADHAAHLCQPLAALSAIPGGFQAQSLTYSSYLERYLLVGQAIPSAPAEPGFYFTTSTDLLHWSSAQLIAKMPLGESAFCATEQIAQYPSLIDPASSSPSFETVGKTAYLYYTRWHACTNVKLDSDLVRVPVEFSR